MSHPTYSDMLAAALGLAFVGLAILLSLLMAPTKPDEKKLDAMRLLASTIGWTMLTLGSVTTIFMVAPVFGWMAVPAGIVVLLMAYTRKRQGQRKALMELLAAAAKQGLPLAPAAWAFGKEAGGGIGHRAKELSAALAKGAPLSTSIDGVGRIASSRELGLLKAGEQLRAVEAALQEAARDDEHESITADLIVRFLYLGSVAIVGLLVLTFVMLKVVPAYKTIFDDFEIQLPAMTVALIDASEDLSSYIVLLMPLFPLMLAAFGWLVLIYIGWVEPRVPFLDRFTSRFDAPGVMDSIAMGLEAGRPLDQTLAALAASNPKSWLRRRLANAAGEVRLGGDWGDSLREQRLISATDAALLKAAARANNLPWALREAAIGARRRLGHRLRAMLEVVAPLLLIVLGVAVGFIVTALFIPLIEVLEQLVK